MIKAPGMKSMLGRCPVGMNWPADTSVAAATKLRRDVNFMTGYASGGRWWLLYRIGGCQRPSSELGLKTMESRIGKRIRVKIGVGGTRYAARQYSSLST
jgi:hypothetical protein